jgi:hypothetical protein
MPGGLTPPQPIRSLPELAATAEVCLACTGVQPIDREGHVFVSIHLAVDARVAITGLRLAGVELLDANGTRVAGGPGAPSLQRVTAAHDRDLGAFDGTLAARGHVTLWTGAQLDADQATLTRAHPTRYRVRLVAAGGVELVVTGAMAVPGATA